MSRKTNRLKARMAMADADVKRREAAVAKREAAIALRDYETQRMHREAVDAQKRAALTITVQEEVQSFGDLYVVSISMRPEWFCRQFHRETAGEFGSVSAYASRIGEEAGHKVRRAIADFLEKKAGGIR